MGGAGQWQKATKTTEILNTMWPEDPLHTQTHTPSRVWEKCFLLLSSSASGKPLFLLNCTFEITPCFCFPEPFEPVARSFSAGEISRQPAVRDMPGPLSLPIYLETLSTSNWNLEILFGFWGEGKTLIVGEKSLRVEKKTNNNNTLFTLCSIYSTNAGGAKQMPETNHSNQT